MTIDYLFKDCEAIADKYESKLIDVVIEFTRIEHKYMSQMIYIPYPDLLRETEDYFKSKLDVSK